jgi:hypothetical protein
LQGTVVASKQFPTLRLSSDVNSCFIPQSLNDGQPIDTCQRRHPLVSLVSHSKKTAQISTGGKKSRLSKSSLSDRASGKPPCKQPTAKSSAAQKTTLYVHLSILGRLLLTLTRRRVDNDSYHATTGAVEDTNLATIHAKQKTMHCLADCGASVLGLFCVIFLCNSYCSKITVTLCPPRSAKMSSALCQQTWYI